SDATRHIPSFPTRRSSDLTYAHETGHVLGQHDEYSTGATDPTGVQPANAPTPNLMSTTGNTTVLTRHYRHALQFLNDNAGGDPRSEEHTSELQSPYELVCR